MQIASAQQHLTRIKSDHFTVGEKRTNRFQRLSISRHVELRHNHCSIAAHKRQSHKCNVRTNQM